MYNVLDYPRRPTQALTSAYKKPRISVKGKLFQKGLQEFDGTSVLKKRTKVPHAGKL